MKNVFILLGILLVIAVAVLLTFKMLQMDSNLSTSIHLEQELKTQVSTLGKENFDYREQLRGYGLKNDKLEKERSRLARQLTEAQSKQVQIEQIAMDQATRVKELEGVSESLNTRDAELSKKDEQVRSLVQELEVMRSTLKGASAESDPTRKVGDMRMVKEAPVEKNVISVWNSRSGVSEEINIRDMAENEVREKLNAAISDLQRAGEKGKLSASDAGLMADMFYNLGVLLTRNGEYKHAVECFNRAIALRPEDADCHYNLAVVYDEQLHNDVMALKHYHEYLRLEPNTPELLKIRKWIIDKEAAIMVSASK